MNRAEQSSGIMVGNYAASALDYLLRSVNSMAFAMTGQLNARSRQFQRTTALERIADEDHARIISPFATPPS
jgi:hypothetical protein